MSSFRRKLMMAQRSNTPNYLRFEAKEASTIGMTFGSSLTISPSLEYSIDNCATWNTFDGTAISLAVGDVMYMRGVNSALAENRTTTRSSTFSMSGRIEAHGNIMSLLYGDNFEGQLEIPSNYCFCNLFYDCTSMTTAPELPATTLKDYCYGGLFTNTSISVAPILPATTMTTYCYFYMFRYCALLTTPPELPAMNLANRCYASMFANSGLVTAPVLPATTLAEYCYTSMFANCTALTTVPELPVTTLTQGCYSAMFHTCTSLTTTPTLPATTLIANCYRQMFYNCSNITTAPELPATTLVSNCYYSMFGYCSKLNYIKAMFTTTPSTSYTRTWVLGVASSGTFVKNSAATWDVTDTYGVPSGWTVETASE